MSANSRHLERVVLESSDISRALSRIAHEILEHNKGSQNIVILGIPSRGVPLANRIVSKINEFEKSNIKAGSLDITMYRDDLRLRPPRALAQTLIPEDGIDNKVVILVDDVLFSGRTIRAALDAINDIGRPSKVQVAVLVDRGHRDLPIRADYVGKNIPTSINEQVKVFLNELDDYQEKVTILNEESL
jgi:pyrimidine operon attenuation protein / uracil phosphoribosyltransferase